MKLRILGPICFILLFLGLFSIRFVHAAMPLPAGSKIFSYTSTAFPVIDSDPSQAKPIGVGDITSDQNLALRVGLDNFSAPVDIYVALYAPAVFPDLFLFRPDGSLSPLSSGLLPWKTASTEWLVEGLLGSIPLSLIPSGDYAFYLLVVPSGTQAASLATNCYLWVTSVGNLRVLDVSERATSLFGGDVNGAAAILMALGYDYDVENISKALLGGKLTQYGEILISSSGERTTESEKPLPSFCEEGSSMEGCRMDLITFLAELHEELEVSPFNDLFEKLVSAYTLYLASLGYSGEQIHEAILGHFFGGEPFIDPIIRTPDFPFGGISKQGGFIKPAGQSRRAVFTDLGFLDEKKNDIPGTEGMSFPSYYKGTGTARLYYSNPSRGNIQCTLNDVVFVAKVGGEGVWDGVIAVYSSIYPSNTSDGDLECRTGLPNKPDQPWRVARGKYASNGTYHATSNTQTYYEESDIKFNRQSLWGNVYGEATSTVYNGTQITEKEWDFELKTATEAEYKAIIPD